MYKASFVHLCEFHATSRRKIVSKHSIRPECRTIQLFTALHSSYLLSPRANRFGFLPAQSTLLTSENASPLNFPSWHFNKHASLPRIHRNNSLNLLQIRNTAPKEREIPVACDECLPSSCRNVTAGQGDGGEKEEAS